MDEVAAWRIMGSSSSSSREASSPTYWTNHCPEIPTQGHSDLVSGGYNAFDPASAGHLPTTVPYGPDALGPSAGLPCEAAGRLRQQSAPRACGKLIPFQLNVPLVS